MRSWVTGARPAELRRERALRSLIPITSGTSTCGRPVETVIVTVSPRVSSVPPDGLWEITSPSGTSDSCSATETPKPSSRSRASADSRDSPVTSGTATCSGPELTSRRTRVPFVTSLPSPGTVRTAKSFFTLSEGSLSTVTLSPASSRSWIACPWRRLATGGTSTFPGPSDTSSVTVEPASASSPGLGSWSTTWSKGCELRTRSVWTSKPARSMSARASTSCLPVTRGTSFFSAVSVPLRIT